MRFSWLTTDDLVEALIERVPVDERPEHRLLVSALGDFLNERWLNERSGRYGVFDQSRHS